MPGTPAINPAPTATNAPAATPALAGRDR
jgi:hypothetical protein